MTVPLDLDAMERGSLSSTARRLIAELSRTRKERDEAREKVHFYEVQYQDEIGINGLIEERDAALATVAAQKAEIGRLKAQLKEMDQHSDAVYAALKERNRLEDGLVTSNQSDRERATAACEPLLDQREDIENSSLRSWGRYYDKLINQPDGYALAAIRREERRASLTDAADWLRRYGRPDAADQMLREVAGDWDWPPANCGAERRDLFIDGEFTAHSGDALPFKIDCDALTDGDIATLAAEIARRVQFASVMGIPRGGLRLAAALERYRDLSQSTKRVLIVDDVLTTGRSMAEAREGLGSNIKGAVIFARGPCSDWITPLFTMGSLPSGRFWEG